MTDKLSPRTRQVAKNQIPVFSVDYSSVKQLNIWGYLLLIALNLHQAHYQRSIYHLHL